MDASRPADFGYTLPAEASPHAGCWMAWPKRASVWGSYFEAACDDYARVVKAIGEFEPVSVVVDPGQEADARRRCGAAARIVVLPIDDSWLRDSGPTFVVDGSGRRAAAAFTFNAWGGKYHPHDQDALAGARIAEIAGSRVFKSPLVAEGGGFCSDGEGTLIVAETCVLNANRNPGMSKSEATAELKAMLGVQKVIWVPGDVLETETDGHVDGYLAYVKPGVLLFEEVADPADPRFTLMAENRRVLKRETDARGRSFQLIPIAEAPPSAAPADAQVFCRSYVNFYLANGAVIAPAYGIAEDQPVFATLKAAYPDRRVVPVQVSALFRGGGGIHCITQQEPIGSATR